MIINNEIVAVSLRDIDRGTEISGRDALNQLRKHILASVGDIDIYSYTDSEANLSLSNNQYASLNPPMDLKKFPGELPPEEDMNEEPVEVEEPGEEKPKQEIKRMLGRGGLRARKDELRRRKMEEKSEEKKVKESKKKSEGKEAAESKSKPKQRVKKGKRKPQGKKAAESKSKPKQRVKKGKEAAESKSKPKQRVKKGKEAAESKSKPKQEIKEKLRREGPREAEEKPKQEVSAPEEKPEGREISERRDYVSLGALEEINEISARHLNTLLSTMIDKKVEMKGISGGIFPINKIPRSMRFRNELIAGIYLRVGGDIKGSSMLLFPRNFALSLADIKKGQETGTTRVLTSEDRSILRELGGVIIFSYMNTLSDFLDINLQFSAPSIAFDMANSIIRFMLSTIPDKISNILLLKTDFLCGGKEIRATFILLLDRKSTKFLLNKINKKKRG